MAAARARPPYLGPSAFWADDAEVTLDHIKADVSRFLGDRLEDRKELLRQTDVTIDQLVMELRRQMAECATDGNLLLAGDLSEAVWDLLQVQKEGGGL